MLLNVLFWIVLYLIAMIAFGSLIGRLIRGR